MYDRKQLDKMTPNELIAALNKVEQTLISYQKAQADRDNQKKQRDLIARQASGKKEKESLLPVWAKIVIVIVVLIFLASMPGWFQWICIGLLIAVIVVRRINASRRAEEIRTSELPVAEESLRQSETKVASLEPQYNEMKDMMPTGMMNLDAARGIRNYLQQGAKTWVEAVQNYQIHRITNYNNYIEYGSYPKETDGTMKPIEWVTLDRRFDRILLMIRDCIDWVPPEYFHSETWEKSRVRQWLNHDFVTKAFTSPQQNNILTVKLENSRNLTHRIPGEKSTYDRVFSLSLEEALQYFSSRKIETPAYYEKWDTNRRYLQFALDKFPKAYYTNYQAERKYSAIIADKYEEYRKAARETTKEIFRSSIQWYTERREDMRKGKKLLAGGIPLRTVCDVDVYDTGEFYRRFAGIVRDFKNNYEVRTDGVDFAYPWVGIRPVLWLKLYS